MNEEVKNVGIEPPVLRILSHSIPTNITEIYNQQVVKIPSLSERSPWNTASGTQPTPGPIYRAKGPSVGLMNQVHFPKRMNMGTCWGLF